MLKQNNYRLRTVFCTLVVVSVLSAMLVINLILVLSPKISAAPTTYLNFQGRLKTASGAVVPDGNYNLEFKIYDHESAGNLLWTETRTGGNRVRVANGYFSVSLGSVTAFPGTIDWSEEHWITMNVGGTDGTPSWDGEMTNAGNRMILTAVPYAFQADKANSLTDGTNTYTSDDFLKIAPGTSQGTNSSDAAVRLNQTGAGGLLQLQSGGNDVFTLSNAGVATLNGTLTVNSSFTGSSGNFEGTTSELTVNPSASYSGVFVASDNIINSSSSNVGSSAFIGVSSYLNFTGDTLNSFSGFSTGGYIPWGSTVNRYYSMLAEPPQMDNGATINSYAGVTVKAADPARTGRQVGLWLTNDIYSQPSGDWAIYSGITDASYLAGALTVAGQLSVGTSDTTGTLLVLDTKTDAGDPTGVNGGMYYNSDAGKFRCYEDGVWKDCITAGGSLFTDAGAHTYLTSTSDSLVVGSASASTPTAKLAVIGTSDQSQLYIQANATQTTPLVLFENSAGAEIARLHTDANSLFLGYQAGMADDLTTNYNTGVGRYALNAVTTGNANTALGSGALRDSGTGVASNVAVGYESLRNNTGNYNTGVGRETIGGGSTGSAGNNNTAVGHQALDVITSGSNNTVLGAGALGALTSGSGNIAIGQAAGDNLTSGSNNIMLGYNLDFASSTGSNQLNIANLLTSSDYTSGNANIAGDLNLGINGDGEGIINLYGSEGNSAKISAFNAFGGTKMFFQASGISSYIAEFRDCCNAVFEVGGTGTASRFNYGLEVRGGNLTVGTSDTTGALLVLDTKTDSGDPTGVNGGMYYNSDAGKFRCYEDGSWKDCISAGGGDVINGGNSGTVTLGTNDANTLTLETNNQSAMTIASGGAVTFQNATNSTDALQVRRADGSSMIQVDTENGRIGFNVPSWASLDYSFQAAGYASGSQSYATFHDATLEGSTTTSQTGHYFNTHGPNNNSSDWRTYYGMVNNIGVTPNGNTDTLSYVGMSATSNAWNGTGNVHQLIGLQSWASAFNDGTVNRLVAIESGRTVSADAEVVESIGVEVRDSDGSGTTEDNYGIFVHSQTAGDNNYGIYVQGASGGTGANYALFVEAGESRFNGQVTIGTSDTTGTLLVLDTKTDSGDPTGVNGAMYYNSDAGKFRCYEDGSWKDCISAGGGDVVNGGQNGALTIGTNDSNTLGFETNGTTRWNINSSGHLLPNADDTYDIGSDTLRVRDIYVGPSSIHIGESGDEVVLSFDTVNDVLNVNQSLSVQGGIISNGTSLNLNADGTQDVNIAAGTSTGNITIGNANSGDVSIYSSGTVGLYGNGGSVGIEVGSVFGLSVNTMQFSGTGTKNIRTSAQGSGHSAGFDIYTGNVTGGTNRQTGDISIRSGNGSGTTTNSGSITIDTGTATGTAGTISIGAANTSNLILGRNGINVNVGGNLVIGTSDTTGTLLVLDTKTDSGDPTGVEGGMYYNSATKSFRCYQNGAWKSCFGGLAFANTSITGNTVSNTSTETNFASNYTIPANSCIPGRVYRVTANGTYSTTSGNGVKIRLKYGSTVIAQTSDVNSLSQSGTDLQWKASFNVICVTSGINGAVNAQGDTWWNGNIYEGWQAMNTSNVTVDTTTSAALVMSADWTGTSSTDSITLRQFIVEDLGY